MRFLGTTCFEDWFTRRTEFPSTTPADADASVWKALKNLPHTSSSEKNILAWEMSAMHSINSHALQLPRAHFCAQVFSWFVEGIERRAYFTSDAKFGSKQECMIPGDDSAWACICHGMRESVTIPGGLSDLPWEASWGWHRHDPESLSDPMCRGKTLYSRLLFHGHSHKTEKIYSSMCYFTDFPLHHRTTRLFSITGLQGCLVPIKVP